MSIHVIKGCLGKEAMQRNSSQAQTWGKCWRSLPNRNSSGCPGRRAEEVLSLSWEEPGKPVAFLGLSQGLCSDPASMRLHVTAIELISLYGRGVASLEQGITSWPWKHMIRDPTQRKMCSRNPQGPPSQNCWPHLCRGSYIINVVCPGQSGAANERSLYPSSRNP